MARQRRSGGESDEVAVRRGVLNQARWEQILQAAANEFYEKGFKAARLQDIANRVGLLTGSLYYYIESKENLLFALVDSAFREGLEATVEDAATRSGGAPLRLRRFIERQMSVLESTQSASVVVVERDRKFLAPEHRAQVDAMRCQLRNHVGAIISEGIAQGDFDADVDIDMATSSLFALLSTTSEWARATDTRAWESIGEWYSRLFLSALSPTASF